MSKSTGADSVLTFPDEYYGSDQLRDALSGNDIGWDVRIPSAPLSLGLIPGRVGELRFLVSWGDPYIALRGPAQLANDTDEFIGIFYQRTGRTIYEHDGCQTEVAPGDIALWYSRYHATFSMPEPFSKLCMVIPVARLRKVLPEVVSYDGLRIEADSHVGALLGSWLNTLAARMIASSDEPLVPCVETTIDMLAATIALRVRESGAFPTPDILTLMMQYIDRRLDDPSLTPAEIALHFGISVRYLYRLFNERKMTLGGWRRARRLARCRAELADHLSRRTITEIAHTWGFSDAAHFSRLFKASYGVSPSEFRQAHRQPRDGLPLWDDR